MTRDQKIAEARKLRSDGLIYREISDRLGISPTCAYKWCNPEWTAERNRRDAARPERRKAKRQWALDHRKTCQCGRLMGLQSASRPSKRCLMCHRAAEKERVAERGRLIEREWKEGRSYREIARAHGWTVNHFAQEMIRLRERGFDLPYRRLVHPTADRKPRFSDQVAA